MIKKYLRSAVAQNAASLYVIQFANYLLPLITVPYVVRVLNPSGYGLVAFGQSFVGYFLIFIDYGFAYSATRKISVARHDPAAVSRTVFSVWGAKLLLCLIGFLALVLLVHQVPTLRQNRSLLFILYGLSLGNVLFPTWLFQGMERMVHISVINLLIRLFVVVGIFTLIKRPEDYLLYAGLNSLGSIVAGLVGAAWAFHLFTLHPVIPSPRQIWETLKEGWMLFLSTASVSLYTVGNAFVLGMLTNPTVVGYYSAGEKIVNCVMSLLGPISTAAFPRFSRMAVESKDQALRWGRRMLFYMGGLGMVLSLILFIGAPVMVKVILGDKYEASIAVVRILALLPLVNAICNVLGTQLMLPFGKDRAFLLIALGGGLLNMAIAIMIAPFWQASGMAAAVIISVTFIMCSMFGFLGFVQLSPFSLKRNNMRP